MVIQHLESRLALSSLNTNEQLHEFQIVHALITQCRKQASAEAENFRNNNNNHNGCENQPPLDPSFGKRKGNSPKEERSSFVRTISRTFNALAQATNPSLCAKQNMNSHPVSIASTVKNIISQFSRQGYHGSVCFANPCAETSSTKTSTPPPSYHNTSVRKKTTPTRKPNGISSQPSSMQSKSSTNSVHPSTSKSPIAESKTPKPTTKSECTSAPKTPIGNTIPVVSTKPKVRSVRARNAHRLTRHESAPIPQPGEVHMKQKATVSVRRSKSDAICYTSYVRRSRRKIDSNVQTKVLHFENCCKGKGQASMCLECRKHNLGQEITSARSNTIILPKIDSVRPKQETFVGALSYHKPSIMSQNAALSKDSKNNSLPSISVCQKVTKTPPPTAARKKAITCPGGIYFPVETTTLPTVNRVTSMCTGALSNVSENKNNELCPDSLFSIPDFQCSQTKRKHSSSEDEPMQSKRESKDDGNGNAICVSLNSSVEIENDAKPLVDSVIDQDINNESECSKMDSESEMGTLSSVNLNVADSDTSNCDTEFQNDSLGACGVTEPKLVTSYDNLYSSLCNNSKDEIGNSQESRGMPNCVSNSSSKNEGLSLTLNLDDSSDNQDSSSSSGESCSSPRQEYLTSHNSGKRVRRTPSTRYQKMRRKLKKLISRSKSCPEVTIDPPVPLTKRELEQQYLETMRFPTPVFMLQKSGSFPAIRQQLAMHFQPNQDWMSRLPDHVLVNIFSFMDTRSLSMLKCVCRDFQFLIDSYDIRGTDSLWVKDNRYIDDPCRFCRKRFTSGDVSMCRYHAKSYHCDLPYGRSYWMCCFQIERGAPGCRTGIHDNHWCSVPGLPKKGNGMGGQ